MGHLLCVPQQTARVTIFLENICISDFSNENKLRYLYDTIRASSLCVPRKHRMFLLAVSPTPHISTGTDSGIVMRNFIFGEGLCPVQPGQRAPDQVFASHCHHLDIF